MLNLDEELEIVSDQYARLMDDEPDDPLLEFAIYSPPIIEYESGEETFSGNVKIGETSILVVRQDAKIGFTPRFYERYFKGDWIDALTSYAVDLSNATPEDYSLC